MAVLLEPIVMMTKSFISKPDEKKFVKMKSNFALVYLVSGMLVPKFRFFKLMSCTTILKKVAISSKIFKLFFSTL